MLVVIQLTTYLVVALDVPIARQVIMFTYLTFVPGIIILSIFRLRGLGTVETLLFSVGLSIAFLMFTGLLMNELYPLLGISEPLSTLPLMITLNTLILVLYVACYISNKKSPKIINAPLTVALLIALFFCLPFMAILGTTSVNSSRDSSILLLLVVVISALILMGTVSKRFFPSKLYPLAIFTISLALLFHTSLISNYLIGYDVHREYYVFKLTQESSYWDKALPNTYNSMLSITILPTIYSSLLSMEGTWIFKIVYPLIFSMVPLVLYQTYRKQTGKLAAFLSAIFFVSSSTFYNAQMLSLMRQMVAELFFVLLLYLLLDERMNLLKKKGLLVIFGGALIVSHYSVSYIYMFLLFLAWLVPRFIKKNIMKGGRTLSSVYVLLFPVMALAWYIYLSLSAPFTTFVEAFGRIYLNLLTDLFNPGARGGHVARTIAIGAFPSFLHRMGSIMVNITQLFILIGFLKLIRKRRGMKFNREFIGLSLGSIVILFASVIIPGFAGILNVQRFYHVTLYLLAPLCILGGKTFFGALEGMRNRVISLSRKPKHREYGVVLISIVLTTFLLFEIGFVYEIAGDIPTSIPLSMSRVNKVQLYGAYTPKQEVFSARWLSKNRGGPLEVFADQIARENVLVSYGGIHKSNVIILSPATIVEEGYVYLGNLNVDDGIIVGRWGQTWNTSSIYPILDEMNKVYSNGESDVYWTSVP